MKDVETRVAALEAENAKLKARLEALQVLLSPTKPTPPRQAQVKITTPPPAKITLPTEDEFRRLLHVVLDRYPVLKPREDPAAYAAQFRSAFIRLAHCGRRDKPDNQRGLAFWLDDCQEWCRCHQINPNSISGGAYTAAVIAHADVPFVIEDWPHDTAFALQFGGGGADPKNWWRRALAGTLLDPTPPLHRVAAPSPVRVQQLALNHRRG
jgi:hypothetical protein